MVTENLCLQFEVTNGLNIIVSKVGRGVFFIRDLELIRNVNVGVNAFMIRH